MHDHHEWPLFPIPEHEDVDMKALVEIEVLLKEGTWPDGFSPEERQNLAYLTLKCHPQPPDACLVGQWMTSSKKSHNIALQGFEEVLPTRVQ